MKKILVAVMAVMMTMGLMAQCPQQKIGCAAQQSETCQAKKECIKKDCIYSPETRAMMQVDRIVRIVKDLTGNERQQLLDFYKSHFINCEKRKEMANPMTKEECREVCRTELRKILGDDRYIQYLENSPVKRMNCEMHRGPRGCKQAGERPCRK